MNKKCLLCNYSNSTLYRDTVEWIKCDYSDTYICEKCYMDRNYFDKNKINEYFNKEYKKKKLEYLGNIAEELKKINLKEKKL